jgi:trimeric autotransporter adhesin
VNHTLAANVENLTLTNDPYLGKGNSLNNEVIGTNGHNFLDGGAGADTMSGARGNDVYVVDNVGDVVIEAANNGTDIVNTSVSYALGDNVENLTLTGGGAINGTGNSLANEITGNSGNNVLDGGSGADTMTGNFGNDTYRVDNTGDVVIEAAGQGTDTVSSSITTYTLGGNVENLTLVGFAIEGFGNSLDNRIIGNGSNNALIGGFGNDFLDGDFGHDNLDGGDGNDTIIGGFGDDSIFGSFGNDTLDGGGGSDYFIFDVRNTGTDVVTEFVVGEDKIVLGNFDPSTDGLTYNPTTGQLFYDAHRGGLDVVQIALISNVPSLSSSDFIILI